MNWELSYIHELKIAAFSRQIIEFDDVIVPICSDILKFLYSTRFDSIFWKKISISNYERFLPSIKSVTHARNG